MGKISLSNITERLAAKSGLSREASDNFIHAFIETVEKGLQEDGLVKIKGLGTFKLQEVNDRESVDVNTGERITIKGYRRVTFTPDSGMKELINRPFAHFEPTELNDGYPIEKETVESDSSSEENEELETAVIDEPAEEMMEPVVDNATAEDVVETVEKTEEVVVESTEDIVVAVPIIEESSSEAVDVAEEKATEDIEEEIVTEGVEETVTEESAGLIEAVEQPEEAPHPEQGAKKRRSGCLWVIALLIIVGIACILHIQGVISDNSTDSVEVDEQNDITVDPNLGKEFGEEWDDTPQADVSQPKERSEVKSDATKPVVTEPISEVPVAEQSPSVVTEDVKPEVVEPVVSTAEPVFCTVKLTESLSARALKDITLADTTDYVIDGTLVTHELESGETIIQLAKKYYGDKRLWPYIVVHNRMKNYNSLAIGQKINIPILK